MSKAKLWTYRSYITPEGVDSVGVWFGGLPANDAVYIDAQLTYNRALAIRQWEEAKEYKRLKKDLSDVEALRFIIERRERKNAPVVRTDYRILGFSDQSKMEFTMVVGFKKEYGPDPYREHGPIALALSAMCRANPDRSIIVGWLNYE